MSSQPPENNTEALTNEEWEMILDDPEARPLIDQYIDLVADALQKDTP